MQDPGRRRRNKAPDAARSVVDFGSKKSLLEGLRSYSTCLPSATHDDDDDIRDQDIEVDWLLDDDNKKSDLPEHVAEADAAIMDWMTENLDLDTCVPQNINEEADRLLVLRSYALLDSPPEPAFDRLTALVQRFFSVPIALVSLVDIGRQWFMSNPGLGDVTETPRKVAFCSHAIQSKERVLVVPDTHSDHRFVENGLVTGPPFIRFYAGAQLTTPEGYNLGTLCAIDDKPRPEGLSPVEKDTLAQLADLVVEAMVRRKHERQQIKITEETESGPRSDKVVAACSDLLAPLHAAQRSVRVLAEQQQQKGAAAEVSGMNGNHCQDLITSTSVCLDVMQSICDSAVLNASRPDDRGTGHEEELAHDAIQPPMSGCSDNTKEGGPGEGTNAAEGASSHRPIVTSELVQSLRSVFDQACPLNPAVPITISVEDTVPTEFTSDRRKLFRGALSVLMTAVAYTRNTCRSIHFGIGRATTNDGKQAMLLFECNVTIRSDVPAGGEGHHLPLPFLFFCGERKKQRASAVGLINSIVAESISCLGGQYGYRPTTGGKEGDAHRPLVGYTVWFSVPLHTCADEESQERALQKRKRQS